MTQGAECLAGNGKTIQMRCSGLNEPEELPRGGNNAGDFETLKSEYREEDVIGFELNPKKTRIYKLRKGIEFLGFRFQLTKTGKVILIADPAKVKSNRKKYRRLVAKAKREGIPKRNVDDSFQSWMDHLSKGNSWKLMQRLQEYYDELWRDENDYPQKKHESGRAGETGKRRSADGGKQGQH